MESGHYVVTTSDGEFAIMGFAERVYDTYYLIIKIDASGNMEWNNTYKALASDCFLGCGFIQKQDGGYVIVDNSGNHSSILKFNSTGDFQWNSTFVMTEDEWVSGNAVVQISDGSYVIAGSSEVAENHYSAYLAKTDSNGTGIWEHSYGNVTFELLSAVQKTSDEGFILGDFSITDLELAQDIYLIKTDSKGNKIWNKTYGGTASERLMSVIETDDKGFAVGGISETEANQRDYLLMKIDSAGNLEWNQTFGGNSPECWANIWPGYCSLVQISDGGYAFIGNTESFSTEGGSDIWLVKTDANGNAVWNKTYGGIRNEYTKS